MEFSFWNDDFLCRYRKCLRKNGYLYFKKVPSNFQWISFSQSLTGTCLIPQAKQVYIRDFKKIYPIQKPNIIHWQTDGCYYPIPPRYIVVWCLEPDKNGQELFLLADGKTLLWQKFSELEQRELMKKQYAFISKDRTQKLFAPILYCPFYTKDIIRYSVNPEMMASDPGFKEIYNRIAQFCNYNHFSLSIEKHSLLIIDNHRMLHSCTALPDSKHHLQRIWLGRYPTR